VFQVGFLALSIVAILVATLRPDGHTIPPGWTFALASGDEAAAELIQNLLLFIPFGAALVLLKGDVSWQRLLLSGLTLSFTVEFLQQWIPGRDPSLGDIVANGLSTLLGAALVWTVPRWLHSAAHRASWLSFAAAAVAATAWLGTGWLFQPTLPHTTYYDRWTPDIPQWPNYRGKVVWAELGSVPLADGPIGGAQDLGRTLLAAGAPLRIRAIAGPAPRASAPLLTINDAAYRDIFIVGVDRADLLVVYRTRGAALTFSRPDLRARGALAGVQPGDTFAVVVWRDCINTTCGLGYTVGDGWKLIYFPEHFPPWSQRLLNALWVGGGLLGVGLWSRRHPASGAALLLAALTLALGPRMVGLNVTPVTEWLGALGGFAVGLAWRGRHTVSSLRAPPF
jgi:hypothetical protein